MDLVLPKAATRFRVLTTRGLARIGFTEESFLLLPAILIGVIAAGAAVAFHELILLVRELLYAHFEPSVLYGEKLWLLVLFPALGGLLVGLIARLTGGSGHGVPDVIESVIKSQGFVKPWSGIQRILTASTTIGSGGSAGAEGPIVQVGAAVASGIGYIFQITRHHMPILAGCGTAAGISAVFNAPIGGVLFTLEVILHDFSVRSFTPLMIASVVANVTTRAVFQGILGESYDAIFAIPPELISGFGAGGMLTWPQLPNFAVLGIACGLVASGLTLLMLRMEVSFGRARVPKVIRPAVGGAAVGVLGVFWVLMGQAFGYQKPIAFSAYPLPAFFSDGYGVIQELLRPGYYQAGGETYLLLMLFVLCIVKVVATCLTLASGGSGGVIAPSLFLGATTGAGLGIALQKLGVFTEVFPAFYALIGMGALLGAVVHAPLAAILILLELTSDYHTIMPAMLATIFAIGTARFIFRDSIYSHALRARGIRVGSTRDHSLMRRLSVEQIGLEPALVFNSQTPLKQVLASMGDNIRDAVVTDMADEYIGMLRRQDVEMAILQPDSIPLLVAGELARVNIPQVSTIDDLGRAMEIFAQADVGTIAVSVPESPGRVVGVITQQFMLRRYHEVLDGSQ